MTENGTKILNKVFQVVIMLSIVAGIFTGYAVLKYRVTEAESKIKTLEGHSLVASQEIVKINTILQSFKEQLNRIERYVRK